MSSRPLALIVHAHPSKDSFNQRLGATAADALSARNQVEFIDLYGIGFAAAMGKDELAAYRAGRPSLDPVVEHHADLVSRASTLVFVYPTWWMGLPGMLKGWLEHVMRPGVAFDYAESGKIKPSLRSVRRIIAITTYGSPRWRMTLLGDGGRRTLGRALRVNVPHRVDRVWLGMHSLDSSTAEQRETFVRRVDAKLRVL